MRKWAAGSCMKRSKWDTGMRAPLVGLVHLLLVVTAYNIRPRHAIGPTHEISIELLKSVSDQLENDMKGFYKDEENGPNEAIIGTKSTSVHQGGADITVRLYPGGMSYLFEQVMLAIRHDARRHRPQMLRASYHGLDIRVDSLQIVDFIVPKLSAEHLGGSNFRFLTHGGGLRYLGLYSATYRTTREGQFEAIMEDMQIQLDVTIEKSKEKSVVTLSKCITKFDDVLVQLTPTMPTQILDLLRELIKERFHEAVCPALVKYVEKVADMTDTLASIDEIVPKKDNTDSPKLVNHEKAAWRYDTRGVKLSFKRTNPRKKRSTLDNNVKDHENIHNEMASVSLTEDYVNEMLTDLMENDNVIFHLHHIPEIAKLLRTHCDEDSQCLGSMVNLDSVKDGSAHLNSHPVAAPFVEFEHNAAFLHLALSTVLSFQNRAAHHRIPYLRLETYLKLRIADLLIDPIDASEYYKWSARYEIDELKVIRAHTDFEDMKVITRDLQGLLTRHQSSVEGLLTTHLNGKLPLLLNRHIHFQARPAVFRHHRVTIPLDFTIERKLFPTFEFLPTQHASVATD
ncbi:unnamed protein product [Cylicocyclus nassatus]|uniref:Lipid-binding serum glycoprotein N-terminal domain-containing protein n=1 Tax=Cylicocyclus nassatus TaxID=53992 RepID=A0AA36HAR6_CYLNA|nr:unnamed protein product [Cylicocyclus nassatus]